MQALQTVVLFLSVSALAAYDGSQAARSRCWSSGNGQSARWWNEGERIDRGKFFYECRGGQLEGKGCFSTNGDRLPIGKGYNAGGYEITCVLGSDGYLVFKYSACMAQDGSRRVAGETWTDPQNTYYYTCAKEGDFLRAKIQGCFTHDKQRKLAIGERYDYGEYTYQCNQKQNGTLQLCSVGCVHNGQHYKVGDQWHEDDFVFYCKMNKGRCQKRSIGCVHDGKSLYDGDRYRDGDSVYQCEIRQDSYGQKPVGCVSRDPHGAAVERVIGCRWYLQTATSKIEQTCQLDGGATKVITEGCIYRHNGFDTIFLAPGSYTIWNLPRVRNQAIGLACRPTSYGAELQTFEVNELAQRTSGLKYDLPRGK